MKETKKEYQQPEITVVKINSNDILCSSPGSGNAGGNLDPIPEE